MGVLPPPEDLPVIFDPLPIEAARRAIVYCYVEWSIPERKSRQIVREAVAHLRKSIVFEFFAIEEDGPAFGEWLISHGWSVFPIGAGAVLWLDSGRCVANEVNAGDAGVIRLIERTEFLWAHAAG